MAEAPVARGILRQAAPVRTPNAWSEVRDALLGRRHPVIRDDVESFFFRDAAIRLGRLVETSLAVSLFALLVWLGTVVLPVAPLPGGRVPPAFWVVAFLPLFALDLRGLQFAVYLRRNQLRFPPIEWVQRTVTATSECVSKLALCAWVASPEERRLPLKLVMVPYGLGYIAHFVLGYRSLCWEDLVRPEGCNSVSWLISEFVRLVIFVFVIMVAAKADHPSGSYPWQAAFWPAWAVVIVTTLVFLALLPVCVLAILRRSPKTLILCWVVPSSLFFTLTSWQLLLCVGQVLSKVCAPGKDGEECRAMRLSRGLLSFASFMVWFSMYTCCLRDRLAYALHTMWYRALSEDEQEIVAVEVLPTPDVMFQITPTYFTRQYMPEDSYDVSELGSVIGSHSGSLAPSTHGSRNGSFVRPNSQRGSQIGQNPSVQAPASGHGSQIGRDNGAGSRNGSQIGRGSYGADSRHGSQIGRDNGATAPFLEGQNSNSSFRPISFSASSFRPLLWKAPSTSSWNHTHGSARSGAVGSARSDAGYVGGGWGASPADLLALEACSEMDASFVSAGGTRHHRDHAASVLTAQGAAYSEIVEDEKLCFVCYADEPDAVLLECGHAGMCVDCAVKMLERESSSCPICRTVIAQVLRIRSDKPPAHFFGDPGVQSRGRRGASGGSSGNCKRGARKARKTAQNSSQLVDPEDRSFWTMEEYLRRERESESLAGTRGRASWESVETEERLQRGARSSWTGYAGSEMATENMTENTCGSDGGEDDDLRAPMSLVPPLPEATCMLAGSYGNAQLPSDSWGDQMISEKLPGASSWNSNSGIPRFPAAAQRTAVLVEGVRCWTQPSEQPSDT